MNPCPISIDRFVPSPLSVLSAAQELDHLRHLRFDARKRDADFSLSSSTAIARTRSRSSRVNVLPSAGARRADITDTPASARRRKCLRSAVLIQSNFSSKG